jgi:hypothetical protein
MPRLVKILLNPISYFLVSAIFLSACSGKSDNNEALIRAMEKSLLNSNNSINILSNEFIQSLAEKKQEPETMEKASIWHPKAERIHQLYTELFTYLSNFKKGNPLTIEQAQELSIRLEKYKEDVLDVDPSIRMQFVNSLPNILNTDTASGKGKYEFYNIFFKHSNPAITSAVLSKIQNDAAIIESKIIAFCNYQIGSLDGCGFFDSYSAIVGQSSSYVKTGEEIKIMAGIVAFSKSVKPQIKFNGRKIGVGEEGYALYKFKSPSKIGKHNVLVEISYFNNVTGKDESRKLNVEYTVAKECDQ